MMLAPGKSSLVLAVLAVFLVASAASAAEWTLPAAVEYALGHNPDLAAVGADVEVARQAREEVFAGFLPQLSGTAGYQYIGNVPEMTISISPNLPIPGAQNLTIEKTVEMGAADNYRAELALNQLVFASGRVYYGHRAAGGQVESLEQQTEAARLAVARKAAEAYLGVLMAREVYDAQVQALQAAEAHLTHVGDRYDAGAASRFEKLRAEVEVANQRPAVSAAAEQVKLAQTMFRRVLGLPEDAPVDASQPLNDVRVDATLADARDLAQQRRPELAALERGAQANEDLARSRRGEMLPAVALTGTYGYQKPYYFNFDGDDYWTVGVGIQVPLFDGLRAWRGMGKSRAQAEGLRLTAARVRADILTEVDAARLALDESLVRLESTEANVKRAADMVQMAEASYAAGALTSLDVIDAQLAATQARVAHLKAIYDHQVALVHLAAATGDWPALGR